MANRRTYKDCTDAPIRVSECDSTPFRSEHMYEYDVPDRDFERIISVNHNYGRNYDIQNRTFYAENGYNLEDEGNYYPGYGDGMNSRDKIDARTGLVDDPVNHLYDSYNYSYDDDFGD